MSKNGVKRRKKKPRVTRYFCPQKGKSDVVDWYVLESRNFPRFVEICKFLTFHSVMVYVCTNTKGPNFPIDCELLHDIHKEITIF